MVRLMFFLMLTVTIFLVFINIANAETLHVNSGESIQQIINDASYGDTIIVRDGIYQGDIKVNKPLTIRSENGFSSTIIQDGIIGGTVLEVTADNVVIDGFTLVGVGGMHSTYAGLYINNADNSNISNNLLLNNKYGIIWKQSKNNILRGNIMLDNEHNLDFWGWTITEFIHDIDTSNKVDGKPIYYWINERNREIPNDAGWVGLVNSTGIIVKDLVLNNMGQAGVVFVYTNDSLIENVTVSNNIQGVYLYSSNNNVLVNNVALSNEIGIRLHSSMNNVLQNNRILNNDYHGVYFVNSKRNLFTNNTARSHNGNGIYLINSINNTFNGNVLSDNDINIRLYLSDNNVLINNDLNSNQNSLGIELYTANNNTIKSNNIWNNTNGAFITHSSNYNTFESNNINSNIRYGIQIYDSNENNFYLNNFKENWINVDSKFSFNNWNMIDPLTYVYGGNVYTSPLGNFWDNFQGVDLDDDGIGDTYHKVGMGEDKYPLMEFYSVSKMPFVPVASFTSEVQGLTVSFSSYSSDSDGNITSYRWDFGDGKASVIQNPEHTYSAVGHYPVTFTVTDSHGYQSFKKSIVSVEGGTLTRIVHPKDVPFGSQLSILVSTNNVSSVTLDFSSFHETRYGSEFVFNIDTRLFSVGEHNFTVTSESESYVGSLIVYDSHAYQMIVKGLDDLATYSVDEMQEISGKTGYTLTNHIYTILLGIELDDNVAIGDLLYGIRDKLGYMGNTITAELEIFKSILILLDSNAYNQIVEMNSVLFSITNLQTAIRDVNDIIAEDNIVASVNEYTMKPLLYSITAADEGNTISVRTEATKTDIMSYYSEEQLEDVSEILLIGREAISNTDREQIYRLGLGNIFGKEISVSPTLDYLAERQRESINPPDDLCVFNLCMPGKYNPVWVFHMTLADAESILMIPAYIGWIPATPEDEVIRSSLNVAFEPISMTVQAITMYMKYVEAVEKISPWIIDGGMVISTDLLAKEVNEEHENIIDAILDIITVTHVSSIDQPWVKVNELYVPKGNIMVTTSPDGRISDFKYVKSDSVFPMSTSRRMVSLNTGWSKTFLLESEHVEIIVSSAKSCYNVNESVNLFVNITSDNYLGDVMLWVFVPEENLTIKDVINLDVGDIYRNYSFIARSEMWHVPRVYVANFDTILAENHTSFGVGTQNHETGLIMLDYDGFYEPGVINMNITIQNTGNVVSNSILHYVSPDIGLSGLFDVGMLEVGEIMTEQLSFNVSIPDVYELYFMLNSSNGTMDYNFARFTVTALDTLFAFPSTDEPLYAASESVDINVTVKNLTLDVVDFPYLLEVLDPLGNVSNMTSFIPEHNGTYIVKAKPIVAGYYVIEGETIFIVERQSNLVVETDTIDNKTMIYVKTEYGGIVENAHVIVSGYTFKTDEAGIVEFMSMNMSQLVIRAEKFGFSPVVSFVNLSNHSVEEDVSLSLKIMPVDKVMVPGDVAYSTVVVEPFLEHPLELNMMICRYGVDDDDCFPVYNPSDEISVLFENTGDLKATSDSNGKAVIRIALGALAVDGARYVYSIKSDDSGWVEGVVVVQTHDNPAIPEFPFSLFIPMMLIIILMRKRYLSGLKEF